MRYTERALTVVWWLPIYIFFVTGICCHGRLWAPCWSWSQMLQGSSHSYSWCDCPGQVVHHPGTVGLLGEQDWRTPYCALQGKVISRSSLSGVWMETSSFCYLFVPRLQVNVVHPLYAWFLLPVALGLSVLLCQRSCCRWPVFLTATPLLEGPLPLLETLVKFPSISPYIPLIHFVSTF